MLQAMETVLLAGVTVIVAVPACWMVFYAALNAIEWWQSRKIATCAVCGEVSSALLFRRAVLMCPSCRRLDELSIDELIALTEMERQ